MRNTNCIWIRLKRRIYHRGADVHGMVDAAKATRDGKMEIMVLPDGATHRGHYPSRLKGQQLAILRNIFTNFAYRSIL